MRGSLDGVGSVYGYMQTLCPEGWGWNYATEWMKRNGKVDITSGKLIDLKFSVCLLCFYNTNIIRLEKPKDYFV